MNDHHRRQIQHLHQAGYGYVRIAKTLGLSENTVKSFLRRNPVTIESKQTTSCRQCGAAFQQSAGHRPRVFCSDQCRSAWWNHHHDDLSGKSMITTFCACCGKPVRSFPSKPRRFCSRACYLSSRYGKERQAYE